MAKLKREMTEKVRDRLIEETKVAMIRSSFYDYGRKT